MVTTPPVPDILILGCGFTGQRVAKLLLAHGTRLIGTTRNPADARLDDLRSRGAQFVRLEDLQQIQTANRLSTGLTVLHSIPPDAGDMTPLLYQLQPARVVYLSSTAVYGDATIVNQQTDVDSSTERSRARLQAEAEISKGPWSSLVLRPAAIYGPGRGVQISYPRGEYKVGDNYVSRIHVDDLAAHVVAAIHSNVTGTYPVADAEPATSRDIATFCANLLGLPPPDPTATFTPSAARITGNRRVDGTAIRELLGVELKYASYRSGIPAALKSQSQTNDTL